jgi:glutamate-1-semialdehyde 2,1-aminomutase
MLMANGVTAQVIGEPPLFDAVFSGESVHDYRGTLRGDAELLRRFNALLRERGVLKGEQKYYVSLAHTPEDIRHTCEAWASAIEVLASA